MKVENLEEKCKVFLENIETGNLMQKQARFLYNITLELKPKIILETGIYDLIGQDFFSLNSHGATSTRIFLIACYELNKMGIYTKLISIDIREPIGMKHILNSQFGRYWIPIFNQDSKRYKWCHPPIDLFFVDGDHTIPGCYGDLTHYLPHYSPSVHIYLHDSYNPQKGVDQAAKMFALKYPEFKRKDHIESFLSLIEFYKH